MNTLNGYSVDEGENDFNYSTSSDLAARKLIDAFEPEAKRDEVQLKPPAFDDEMLVVCYVLDITVHYKMVMRNMRCFAPTYDHDAARSLPTLGQGDRPIRS